MILQPSCDAPSFPRVTRQEKGTSTACGGAFFTCGRILPHGFSAESVFLEHSRAVSAQNPCFWSIPARFQRRIGVSGAFPRGFSAESVFLEHSRTVSAQNRCFWSIPERFQRRIGVSEAFPNGFSVGSVFLEHSRAVSAQNRCFPKYSRTVSVQNQGGFLEY